jgi:hypothetical protein
MTEKIDPSYGIWRRHSKYIVRDGYILPAPDAKLQAYDPWKLYREHQVGLRPPPYQTLLKLVADLGGGFGRGTGNWRYAIADLDDQKRLLKFIPRAGLALFPVLVRRIGTEQGFWPWPVDRNFVSQARALVPLPTGAEEVIAGWCSEYGPLGILHHVTSTVSYAPLWHPTTGIVDIPVHVRSGGDWDWEWHSVTTSIDPVEGRDLVDGYDDTNTSRGEAGDFVPMPRDLWPAEYLPHVVVHPLESSHIFAQPIPQRLPLRHAWAPYFPTIPYAEREAYNYPAPSERAFWRIYAEPLEVFIRHAVILACTIESMQCPGSKGSMSFDRTVLYMNKLLSPIGLSACCNTETGTFSEDVSCPSLISAFAKMALQDKMGGYRLFRCESCRSPALTTAERTRFCSRQCSWRAGKQRFREAQKEMKARVKTRKR